MHACDHHALRPTLGYLVGMRSGASVCVVDGLGGRDISRDDLKAFSAAFGTTGGGGREGVRGWEDKEGRGSKRVGGRGVRGRVKGLGQKGGEWGEERGR